MTVTFRDHRLGRVVTALVFAAGFAAVFAVHARWILTHFSSDGYLCDSGWLAFLFEHGGPLLRNPSAVVGQACGGVNQQSFLANHLSPHIFLFGAPFARLFRSPGIEILAYHQGLFFGLYFMSLVLLAAAATGPAARSLAAVIAVAVGTLSNVLFQAASYPHYEIATMALTSLAIAARLSGHPRIFGGCLIWLPLVREDGGLYAAFACLACFVIERSHPGERGQRRRRLILFAALEIAASACAFTLKHRYFPGFDAFAMNFAGDSWSHLSAPFLAERVWAGVTSWNIAPVLFGSMVLLAFDRRYVTGLVLLTPLFVMHLVAVRPEHGHFTLYFALPWLLPVTGWLAVFVERAEVGAMKRVEAALLVLLALLMTAPAHAAVGSTRNYSYVPQWALTRRIANFEGMTEFASWVSRSHQDGSDAGSTAKAICASTGIAALVPDALMADQVLSGSSPTAACRLILLLRRDMHYDQLKARAAGDGFRLVAERENAELWAR